MLQYKRINVSMGQSHHGNMFYHWKQIWKNHNISVVARQNVAAILTVDDNNEDCEQKRGKSFLFARNDSCLK
jgi:hypothetical protein